MPRTHVQLDKDDPIHERLTDGGQPRLQLSADERSIIARDQKWKTVFIEFAKNGKTIPDIAGELGMDTMDISMSVTRNEYPPLRDAVARKAVEMFLDFDEGVTRKQIQEHLGMSPKQLRKFTQSEDFELMYNEHFFELRSHPTIRAVQAQIVDELLPKAYMVFDQILDNLVAPPSVRLKAALTVMDKAGIQAVDPQKSNRQELAAYLTSQNVTIENVNVVVPIPPEFQEALDANAPIEGEFIEET